MQSRFSIDASAFTAFEREELKRSIIAWGKKQDVKIWIVTERGCFKITAEGERPAVVAYEAAVCDWFHIRPEGLRP
jgi:hypothetical protein